MLQWLLQLAVLLDIKYNHLLSQETLVHTLIIVIIIMSFTFLVNQNCSTWLTKKSIKININEVFTSLPNISLLSKDYRLFLGIFDGRKGFFID